MNAAPLGALWRPSDLPHLRRVQILERADGSLVGSIGPGPRGSWIDRDTGESFATVAEAKQNVEKYLTNSQN